MESPEHLYQKQRIRDLARARGLISENEIPFWCWSGYHDRPICYYADTFACSNTESAATIVEIDGYKGHSNRNQAGRDERRTEDIKGMWGDHISVLRFTIGELESATDEEIQEEIGI